MKAAKDEVRYARCRVCGAAYMLLEPKPDRTSACRCGAPAGALEALAESPNGRRGFLGADPTATPLPEAEVEALRDAWAWRQQNRQAAIDAVILDEYYDAPAGIGVWPPTDTLAYRHRWLHAVNAWPFMGQHLAHAPAGWVPIIERACVEIAMLGDDGDNLQTADLKEKFGTLRWYADNATRQVQDIIDEAEERTAATCACCGAGADAGTRLRGRDDGRMWALTLCDACHARPNDELMRRMYPEG